MNNLKFIFVLAGIFFSNGYDDLSRKKSTYQSTTFPCNRCPDGSYNSSMAVDNNMETCTRTDKEHNPWWMVDLRETKAIYAINFSFRLYTEDLKRRQEGRLSGYSLYVSNSPAIRSGQLCFKHNGSYPPSLTTEHVCTSFGRYIQFVNEMYTFIELCNLVVLGCDKRGYCDDNCNVPCPKHCKNGQCFVTNGTCLGCESGWTGTKCNQACSNGKYGPDCSLSCSGHCKHNLTCNPINGTCSNGCSDGWMGVICNKTCVSGTFGSDCKNNCSGNCLYDLNCNRTTGKCDSGCKHGYQGELCNAVCSFGYYGHNCLKQCSPLCFGKSCHNINGNCNFGCISGYQGPTCEHSCNNGSYGQNCSLRCEKCVNQSCNHISGMCHYGCEPGWIGPQCSEVCTADKYGTDCMFSCSQNCVNKESCDHVTGVCKNGCLDGYKGELCNLVCGNGYFGANCSNVCSKNCSDICHHIDGTCNCKAGIENSPECKQVSSLTMARKCDDHWFYAIGMSIFGILNVLTCALWICERRKQVKVRRYSSSHYITTEVDIKEKTSETHEYQDVKSVSRDFSYQNLTFET